MEVGGTTLLTANDFLNPQLGFDVYQVAYASQYRHLGYSKMAVALVYATAKMKNSSSRSFSGSHSEKSHFRSASESKQPHSF